MIGQWIARFVFGFGLMLCTQIPHFMNQYTLVLSGAAGAYAKQVNTYEAIADMHGFPSAKAMIQNHLVNDEPSVQDMAREQLNILKEYVLIETTLERFEHQNLFEKLWVMQNPQLQYLLKQTYIHFKWGIPFTQDALVYGVVGGIALSLLVDLQLKLIAVMWGRLSRRKKLQAQEIAQA